MMNRLCLAAAAVLSAAFLVLSPVSAEAQSVLREARGLKSNNINVLIDRAIVLESNVRFVEVSVANPAIADVQPISDRSIYIFGRQRGATSLTLLGENGTLITNVLIKVTSDISELKRRMKELLPNEPIEIRNAGGRVIMSGTVSGKDKIDQALTLAAAFAGERITNMMTVGGTQQVMLKVKVAEIARTAAKDLGISISAQGSTGRTAPIVVTGTALRPDSGPTPSEGAGAGGSGPEFSDFVTPLGGAFAGVFGAAFTLADNFILDLQIDALEGKGFARTLSEPNLVTLSGTQASFLAGGEVPIPVIGEDGEVTVEFKNVGVDISFLPRVLDNELINMAVTASVSEVDPSISTSTSGIEVVGFQTRRASTTVELKDGQSFAIAGLLQESFTDTVSQVPWLGDVPILGALFRSSGFQRGESELVIFVSAHLVTPVDSEDDLSLPTDRVALPNEYQLFLLGATTAGRADGGSGLGIADTEFDGDFGYVVE